VTIAMISFAVAQVQTRTLSVYSDYFVGRTMANGKPFSHDLEICAANSWHLGTKLKVTFNGKSKVLEVADRMNKRFTGKRIDLPRGVYVWFEDKPDGLHRGAVVEVVE
jgi:rare lipoprotein A (peptidoglycan hydrolase)